MPRICGNSSSRATFILLLQWTLKYKCSNNAQSLHNKQHFRIYFKNEVNIYKIFQLGHAQNGPRY